MILSVFSTLGLQGNWEIFKFWLINSGTSNHLTNSTDILKNIREYDGLTQIYVANGTNLPITKIGDSAETFKNVFVSPKLSTNLISVGQLVDKYCNENFFLNGCLVQDQVFGR